MIEFCSEISHIAGLRYSQQSIYLFAMPTFEQASRPLGVATPFGVDKLILTTLRGREEMSRPFEYELEMISTEESLDAKKIVGEAVSVRLDLDGESDRYFHGIVREFAHTGWADEGSSYHAIVVPRLWTLSQTTDCRIFQKKSSPEIIEQIFKELGVTDYELRLKASYDPWEYCVQYRESDLDFVSRLMEEEGIFYYFLHESGKHTIVLGDSTSAYEKLSHYNVEYSDPGHSADNQEQLTQWRHGYSFRPGAYAQTAYNFETPSANLMAKEKARSAFNNAKPLEVYDYHGRHPNASRGRHLSRVRIEQLEAGQDVAQGEGNYRSFAPGGKFKFAHHRSSAEIGKEYVATTVDVFATVGGSYTAGGSGEYFQYYNRFSCIPAEVTYRPERRTARPIVEGPQTAVIVGPKSEEIYTDEFSRVKVQFHWDREGKKDENSSCWVRVSQAHAGKGWGYVDIPRIGEEVIVDFIEGDPDAPIITGRVYNAEVMPPFPLKGGDNAKNKTRRGNTTKSYKAAGYNEMSMDDTPGAEQIRVHGQYNMDTVIENDETHTVHNNRTRQVDVDEKVTVGNNQEITVANDRAKTVVNNETTDVGVDRTETVGNNEMVTVAVNRTTQIGSNDSTTVAANQDLTVGASRTVSVAANQSTTVGASVSNAVGASQSDSVAMNRSASVGLIDSANSGLITNISAGLIMNISAGVTLTLTGPGGTITIGPSGIHIKGTMVTIEGNPVFINP